MSENAVRYSRAPCNKCPERITFIRRTRRRSDSFHCNHNKIIAVWCNGNTRKNIFSNFCCYYLRYRVKPKAGAMRSLN